MMALPKDKESRLTVVVTIERCRSATAAKKGQAIKVACKGLAHVESSRTRKMEVAMRAVMVCMGSLLS